MRKSMKIKDHETANLRSLDDVACTNVMVARQIKRMIRKFPSMNNIAVDCWAHNGHYTRFKFNGEKISWSADTKGVYMPGCKTLTDDSNSLDKFELNKLLVHTYRTMCDSQNGVDLVDTPEDLLAFAETKLKDMLREESLVYAE